MDNARRNFQAFSAPFKALDQSGRELERARSIALGAGGIGLVALALGALAWFRRGKA